jgi:hypothetical protein
VSEAASPTPPSARVAHIPEEATELARAGGGGAVRCLAVAYSGGMVDESSTLPGSISVPARYSASKPFNSSMTAWAYWQAKYATIRITNPFGPRAATHRDDASRARSSRSAV